MARDVAAVRAAIDQHLGQLTEDIRPIIEAEENPAPPRKSALARAAE
jgi:hypothetical protein